jgi:serine/threonine-protein kinase
VLRESQQPALPPPPARLAGNRHTGTMPRVTAPRRRTSTWAVVALTLLGILAVGALGAGLYLAGRTPQSQVPELIGLTAPQAQSRLSQAKLNGSGKIVNDSTCAKDKVFQQDPKPGVSLPQGQTVSYNVCGGPGTVMVPQQLVGLSRQQADNKLRAAHLTPVFDSPVDGLVSQKDKVVSTDPAEGASVAENSVVHVRISKGNQQQVPDLTRLTAEDARRKLADLGFTNIRQSTNINPPAGFAGKVVSQSPDPGTPAKLSEQISIVVGAANTPSPSPSPSPPSPTSTR